MFEAQSFVSLLLSILEISIIVTSYIMGLQPAARQVAFCDPQSHLQTVYML